MVEFAAQINAIILAIGSVFPARHHLQGITYTELITIGSGLAIIIGLVHIAKGQHIHIGCSHAASLEQNIAIGLYNSLCASCNCAALQGNILARSQFNSIASQRALIHEQVIAGFQGQLIGSHHAGSNVDGQSLSATHKGIQGFNSDIIIQRQIIRYINAGRGASIDSIIEIQLAIHTNANILQLHRLIIDAHLIRSNAQIQPACRALGHRSLAGFAGNARYINIIPRPQGNIGNLGVSSRSALSRSIQNTHAVVRFTTNGLAISLIGSLANAAAASFQGNIPIVFRTDIAIRIRTINNAHQDTLVGAHKNVATTGDIAHNKVTSTPLVHINATSRNSTQAIHSLVGTK